MEMLRAAGAQDEWEDADGKTCKQFEHGKLTEYMVCMQPSCSTPLCAPKFADDAEVVSPASAGLHDIAVFMLMVIGLGQRKLNEEQAKAYEEQRRRMQQDAVDIEDDDDEDVRRQRRLRRRP